MNSKRRAPLYVSPTTGKTANDYVMDAIYASDMSARKFCKSCGFKDSGVTQWAQRALQPSISTLFLVERFTGRKIADYLPEVMQGITLLQHADEWRRAFGYKPMRRFGLYIGANAKRIILHGGDIATTDIKLETVAKVCDYYEWWMMNSKSRKERGCVEYVQNQYEMHTATVNTEEEEKALKAYHWAMQSYNAKMYDLHRIRDYVWEFGTIHWRCELDLILKELRIYWRKTGALNSTRPFDADTLKDNVRIIRKGENDVAKTKEALPDA